ncbi:MAG: site-specific integrase [Candidatus Bathyarchaeota archaeon]|nr:site-specific integrase [Candidatus Bathyarchaeota archaeon]
MSVCGKKTATFLQILKESGARRGEIGRLQWTDVDTNSGTIRINSPLKGSSARIVRISGKAMAMINAMPRTSDYVFNPNTSTMAKGFMKQRNRLAKKLQNPRLKQIHFHTLRHWKATMEYHKTKDILHVVQVLGHKNINNTLMYTQLINFENDDYHCKTAKTLKEDQELIEVGFEFVTERDGTKIYRKRK